MKKAVLVLRYGKKKEKWTNTTTTTTILLLLLLLLLLLIEVLGDMKTSRNVVKLILNSMKKWKTRLECDRMPLEL